MPPIPTPLTLETIDYSRTFGFTQLFRSFRMAMSPTKLLLALALLLVMYLVGTLMDATGHATASAEEFGAYVRNTPAGFAAWMNDQRSGSLDRLKNVLTQNGVATSVEAEELAQRPDSWAAASEKINAYYDQRIKLIPEAADRLTKQRDEHLALLKLIKPDGVFATVLRIKSDLFTPLMIATVQLQTGFEQLASPQVNQTTIIGNLRLLVVSLPGWLLTAHKLYLLIFMTITMLAWSLIGGAISRLCVVEAARSTAPPAIDALRFVSARWGHYVGAPLVPLAMAALASGLLAAGGLIFNVPYLDTLGGLLFVLALVLAFVAAMIVVVWLAAVHLMYPALSAEGSDFLDAVSRSFNYVVARPWRMAIYGLVSLVYWAATYLFVGLMIFLTLWLSQWVIEIAVFRSMSDIDTTNRFAAIFPPPQLGRLQASPDLEQIRNLPKGMWPAAVLVKIWTSLLVGLLAAYAVNFYFSASSIAYLLLRRQCDGTEIDEVYTPAPAPQPSEKVEPEAATGAPASEPANPTPPA